MRIPRFLLACCVGVGVLAALPASSQAVVTHYYLALGDSLSVGHQPSGDTNQGYADDLFTTLHGRDHSLVLKKLGCSGETTGSMINGGVCADGATRYPVTGTQLGDALAFIAANKPNIKYLTLDIGANDVDGCTPGGSINVACLLAGTNTIAQNLNTILAALKSADGGLPKSVGMAYYDPFLQFWLGGTQGQLVATASVSLLAGINLVESTEYTAYGFAVADAFTAFKTLNFTPFVNTPPYGKIPVNVATICNWTWMCSVQNIHPNATGYQKIAGAFLARLN
jgi:lysophospholipase L1-like esterase